MAHYPWLRRPQRPLNADELHSDGDGVEPVAVGVGVGVDVVVNYAEVVDLYDVNYLITTMLMMKRSNHWKQPSPKSLKLKFAKNCPPKTKPSA